MDPNQDMTCVYPMFDPKSMKTTEVALLSLRFGESFLPLCKHVRVQVRTTCIKHAIQPVKLYKVSEINISLRTSAAAVRKMFCSCLEHRFPLQQSRHRSNQMMSSICLASLCNTSQMPEKYCH